MEEIKVTGPLRSRNPPLRHSNVNDDELERSRNNITIDRASPLEQPTVVEK